MNRTGKIVLFVLLGLLVAAGIFFAGQAYSRSRLAAAPGGTGIAGWREWGWRNLGHPGMMQRGDGGWGRGDWAGPGGMMGPGFDLRAGPMGPGMQYQVGPMMGPTQRRILGRGAAATPLSIADAQEAAQAYVDALGIDGLELGEVMIFNNHAYVVVEETGTGLGAFELLVDPSSKLAYPEHGPNLMWNQKYGAVNHTAMMGGLFGGQEAAPADVSAEMRLDEAQARAEAQAFLDNLEQGGQVSAAATTFYGYYTFDYEIDGQVAGMLSVNGFSGAVFPHHWHGTFVEEAE